MYRFLRHVLLPVLMAILPVMSIAQSQEPVPGVVRVKLQKEAATRVGSARRAAKAGQTLSTGIAPLDESAKKMMAVSIEPLFPPAPKFAAERARFGLDQWYEIRFDESVDPRQAKAILAATGGVEIAEPIVPMSLMEGNGNFVKADAAPRAASSTMPFDDPRLPAQWHYFNDGSIPLSAAGADINLFEAWKTSTGRPDVIVAIIDGGVDYTHQDLAANMLINTAELNGTPGVDDDGNGYVDDIYGYNFVTNSPELYPHSHGTHVAGTVAAVNNNHLGVCGIAGGDGTPDSGIRMLSCQVFDSRAGTGDGDFAKAIVYAAERGASIAQCSWGWPTADYYEQAVIDAIDYFTDMARSDVMAGGLCIFAPGNDGLYGAFYPAAYEKCVAVTAMDAAGLAASYSNHGPWADVTAPGGDMDFNSSLGVLSTLPGDSYGYNEGTSMATPHVSGIAALILSAYGNSTFPAETLRQQLVSSVNDFYVLNPDKEGNFGSGYIDAGKAMRMGQGNPPSPVADFSLAPSQDEIAVTWTIPASDDNGVNHHIIYYSTSEFSSSSDLSRLPSVVVDTRFASSGDTWTYDLTGLRAMTTYYVAIRAVDRWGASSDLSPVLTATTNAGPKMTLDVSKYGLNLTARPGSATSGSFTLGNTADGLLKWSVQTRTIAVTPAAIATPDPGRVVPYSGSIGIVPMSNAKPIAAEDFDPADYPTEMAFYDYLYANIGDSNPRLPNSLAQMFTVSATEYPEGFNLTHLLLDGANGVNPVIEIYKGTTISSATLLKTVEYSTWTYNFNTALDEQLYFAPGESFWVVYHFEASETLYPLGFGYIEEPDDSYNSNTSYMSTDHGATWTRLSDALAGTKFEGVTGCWAVRAISNNPDWSCVLALTPDSGTIEKGKKQTVSVTTDGTQLVNGTYSTRIRFNTNESEPSEDMYVPVTINATGAAPQISGPKVVNFGDILVGQSRTLRVEVYNSGYGRFTSNEYFPALYEADVTSNSEHFSGPDYISGGFPARTRSTFEVTFEPKSAGSHTGIITFSGINGQTYSLMVQGVATDPAKMVLDPAVVDAGTIDPADEPRTVEFEIANEGNYPLEYVFPKFSTETIDDASDSNVHRFGYTVQSNLGTQTDVEYDGNPSLLEATDISSSFTDDVYVAGPFALGFDFPYYGKTYNEVYITSFGGVMMAPNQSTFRSPLTEESYGIFGAGLISAWGFQMPIGPASSISYGLSDGKFVVKFANTMGIVYDTTYTPISFRIVLDPSGDIEIFYDDYTAAEVFQEGLNLYNGISSTDEDDPDALTLTSGDAYYDRGVDIYGQFGTGTAVRYVAPKPYFVQAIEPAHGLVAPGQRQRVTATVAATDDLYAGATYNNVAMSTNDPQASTTFVRFDAVIEGDGLLPVAAAPEASDWGEVFRTADAPKAITLRNSGRAPMTVNSAKIIGDGFSLNPVGPFSIDPGRSKDFIVTLDTSAEGQRTASLSISTDGGDIEVSLIATVIGAPEIKLSYERLTAEGTSGETVSKPLTISNPGNETLLYTVIPNSILEFPANLSDEATTTYVYTASADDSSVEFAWEDIETNGLGSRHDFTYFDNHDFFEVELPFAFPFYGKAYTHMYVYNTGFVSFSYIEDQHIWPEPPESFPRETLYTNIIAPYWGLHSMDTNDTAGVYYHADDDHIVISFIEYGNSMNIGVDYQLIMRRDGTFKMQYKAANSTAQWFGTFGLAGISNADASAGFKLPERLLVFDNAIEFMPLTETAVEPGESSTVDISVPLTQMDGVYTSTLVISTNVPHSERVEVPVELTVHGIAAVEWPADTTIVHPVGYAEKGTGPLVKMGAAYEALFAVANPGTAAFTIDSIDFESPTYFDSFFNRELQAFDLYYETDETDRDTGEPTGNKTWKGYDGQPVSVGRDGAWFSVPNILVSDLVGDYDVYVTFHISGVEGQSTHKTHVRFEVTPAPAMQLLRGAVNVEGATPGTPIREALTLRNVGEYPLSLTVRIDPTGQGETDPEYEEDDNSGISPWSTGPSESIYDTPTDGNYLNALYHPVPKSTQIAAYNFGANNTYDDFKASTRYTSPEGGFNVGGIYTAINYGSLTDINLTVEIISGTTPTGSSVIATGSLHVDKMADPSMGQYIIIPLDSEVYIPEGQDFCVVVTYPRGVEFPTYLVAKSDAVEAARYMAYYDSYGWFDPATYYQDTYGSMGYIATCLEYTEGGLWVELADELASATVAPGESFDINLDFYADRAPLDTDNQVMLVIRTNDPKKSLLNIPVTLSKNAAPVITIPSSTIYVSEDSSSEFTISVTDAEGDAFSVAIDDTGKIASVKSATSAEGAEVSVDDTEITVPAGAGRVDLVIALTAQAGDSGNYWLTASATDQYGSARSAMLNYTVEHVNHAPVAIKSSSLIIPVGKPSDMIDLYSLFTDPDGDDLTFEVSVADVATAQPFVYGSSLILYGQKLGFTKLNVTATDPNGLSADNTVTITVSNSGINDAVIETGLTVYPNPVEDVLHLTTDFSASRARVVLHNAAGALVFSEETTLADGREVTFSVGHLRAGFHILSVIDDEGLLHTLPVVKR